MPYIDTKHYDIYYDIQDIRIESPLFEVDEFIAPIISLLNKKGYTTEYCCSGHIQEIKMMGFSLMNNSCYIQFKDINQFKDVKEYPKQFAFETDNFDEKRFTIRKTYKNTGLERYYEILETMRDLLNWINYMPNRGNVRE